MAQLYTTKLYCHCEESGNLPLKCGSYYRANIHSFFLSFVAIIQEQLSYFSSLCCLF